jgi:hypothetical protein
MSTLGFSSRIQPHPVWSDVTVTCPTGEFFCRGTSAEEFSREPGLNRQRSYPYRTMTTRDSRALSFGSPAGTDRCGRLLFA